MIFNRFSVLTNYKIIFWVRKLIKEIPKSSFLFFLILNDDYLTIILFIFVTLECLNILLFVFKSNTNDENKTYHPNCKAVYAIL